MRALVAAVLFLIVLSVVSISSTTLADDGTKPDKGRLISIYDRGYEKVILSKAGTVGEALDEAGILIDDNDLVEPEVDEKLVSTNYKVNIYRSRPILVVDGGIRLKIITARQTPKQIAASGGITLYPEDEAVVGPSDNLADGVGMQMTIKRATAFTLTLYGNTTTVRTQGSTIKEMLAEKGIKLSKDDRVSIDENTKITTGLAVKVWREGKQTITVDEVVDFDIEKIEDADRDISYKLVKSAGDKGMRSVTYEVTIQDGQEVGRKEIASLVTKQPKKQIEVVGVKGQYTTPSENETITWNYLMTNGFNRVQTAGIMGNLMQEHRFNTTGDGLAQWTGGRKAKLYSKPYPNNIYTQLDFLMEELNGGYAGVRDKIRSSNSLAEAVRIFQDGFEKCGTCAESNRIKYASNILASH